MNSRVTQSVVGVVFVLGAAFLATLATTAQAQTHTDITSTFTDAAFRAVVQAKVGSQVVYADEVARVTELELTGEIGSIAGLEHFAGLNTLKVVGNEALSTLTLPNLPALKFLAVSRNSALSTMSLSNLPALEFLAVSRNSALSTMSLSNLPALKDLSVSDNTALSTLSLPNLPALKDLGVYYTALSTLSLPNLPALKSLWVVANTVLRTLTLPQSLSNLRSLGVGGDIAFQAIESRWEELAPHLEELGIYGLSRTEIRLPNLPALKDLGVYYTALSTLSLPNLPALKSLWVVANTVLRTLTLPQSLSNLRSLGVGGDIAFQAIESRWEELAPHLESLEISGLSRTEIRLPNLPALKSLQVSLNAALRTLLLAGAIGSTSVNTHISLWGNHLQSLDALIQIIQSPNPAIRSSLGAGDTLSVVDQALLESASPLRAAGVTVRRSYF